MINYKLSPYDYPQWIYVTEEEPTTVYLGGDLWGMNYTIRNYPECVSDPRLYRYPSLEWFIVDHIEDSLIHEDVHIACLLLDEVEACDMWDNIDNLNQLSGFR